MGNGPDSKPKIKCKNCLVMYIIKGTQGTMYLKCVIDNCKETCEHKIQQMILSATRDMIFQSYRFNEDVFCEAMEVAIAKQEYPFQIVEHYGLRAVFKFLNLNIRQ